jgi:hypothetical protein
MWIVIQYKKNKETDLISEIKKKINSNIEFYIPKIRYRSKKNSINETEENILNDYMFVKSEKFQNKNFLNLIKYTIGLKSILNNFKVSQKNILDFLNKCKFHEKEGMIKNSFFSFVEKSEFIFLTGPFYKKIFKIVNREKNFLSITINEMKIRISNKNLVYKNL